MRLLLCLAEHAGETVTTDELMDRVWPGTIVTQDSLYQSVAALRRLLGDDPKNPAYIATVPRRGYRMVAKVLPEADPSVASAERPVLPETEGSNVAQAGPRAWRGAVLRTLYSRAGLLLGAGALVAVALGLAVGGHLTKNAGTLSPVRAARPQSIAVLPFLDLTSEAMDHEYFADGMTEELIDRLSKVPGLQVPPPTASFYFKGKRMPVSAIAKELNVAYVVDGSVRKSDTTLRVAARLIRADDGFIVWSEAYDRPSADVLKVQDDIAGEVAKALQGSRALQSPQSN
jgi:TolB-like protein/DNA-binding winged helix-turn-helix (wHTH) protein